VYNFGQQLLLRVENDNPYQIMRIHNLIGRWLYFIEQIEKILRETNLAARYLILKITESMIIENEHLVIEKLTQLRTLGVKLSINDFGIDYASLDRLHRLPINILKIDRSFVSKINNNQKNLDVTRTLIEFAYQLNMDVIAEGVETKEQVASLKKLNCNYVQGYFFSHPLHVNDVATAVLTIKNQVW
jgi:EAL domain-containing protein (putative c-di-GMP-specific phosphodiesterase class I)